MRIRLLLLILLGACGILQAQYELSPDQARQLRQRFMQRYEAYRSRSQAIEAEQRALNERDAARIEWYETHATTLMQAIERLDLVISASYRLNEEDLDGLQAAGRALKAPLEAPSFEDTFPDPQPLHAQEVNLLERKRLTQPEIFGQPGTDPAVLLERVEALFGGGFITRFEYLRERFLITSDARHWAELVTYLETLYRDELISEGEFRTEMDALSDTPSTERLKQAQLEDLRLHLLALKQRQADLAEGLRQLELEILKVQLRIRIQRTRQP